MRVCPAPGCPELMPAGARYCPVHLKAYEAKRGTSTARGYGSAHQRRRAMHQARMDAGARYVCPRCGTPILPGQPWDLGHDDDDRTRYVGPEHSGPCNRAAGGARGAATRSA